MKSPIIILTGKAARDYVTSQTRVTRKISELADAADGLASDLETSAIRLNILKRPSPGEKSTR
jgi:hypothetical protein